jgi:glycosyltransferase involved in cell wall biosynthesis
VLPSGKEGFGIVFLEAMYFGAPVIAASEKGALDVIRDGETGLLVRFGDSIALKKAIERLRDDAALRERLRERGRATVIGDGEFTFRRFSIRTADIFSPTRQHAA